MAESAPPLYQRRFTEWLGARGMRCEPFRYRRAAAGGETGAYLLRPPGTARALVVFVHGTGNDALFPQINLFQALLERGFAVWTWDLDGHGRRSTTWMDPQAISTAASDAVAEARVAFPGVKLHLLGQSFGASLALHALAGDQLGPVASAVALSAPLRVRPTARTVVGELAGFATRTCLAQRAHYGLWGAVPAFGRFKRAEYPIRLAEARGGSWDYVGVVNRALAGLDLLERAAQVQTPALLVYGARDWIVPLAHGEALHERLPGAELRVLPRATHCMVPFAPETEQAVLTWFDRHS